MDQDAMDGRRVGARRAAAATAVMLALAGPATAARVEAWSLPSPVGASAPNLAETPDGALLLSWIEPQPRGHRLRYAMHRGGELAGGWSVPETAASGEDWFVNWADVPSMLATADGALWAHVLVRNGEAAYAYDTRLFLAEDGRAWQALGPVHDDGTATEHGFATLWPRPDGGIGIAWLDGRDTAGGHGGHGGHDAAADAGTMTLRAATYRGPRRGSDDRLDDATCDCCQTDSAVDGDAVWLAWRDRAAGEVRDIVVARADGGRWNPPQVVHADGWVMPACPVNGPAIAARDGAAWVAWYTAAGGSPQVRIARGDGDDGFAPPRTLAAGEAQHGRVDVAADAGGVWVAWLEDDRGRQSLWLARLGHTLEDEHFRLQVATLAGRGRATGVPRLRVRDGAAWLAWTDVADGVPRLHGARVSP